MQNIGIIKIDTLVLLMIYITGSDALRRRDIPDYKGREFVLGFMQNEMILYSEEKKVEPELFITTESVEIVQVKISAPLAPDLMNAKTLEVTQGEVVQVLLPTAVLVNGTRIENKGLHIEASDEIIVYGVNKQPSSSDSFMGLPVDVLGTSYYAASYQERRFPSKSEILVIGVYAGTEVNITLPWLETDETVLVWEGEEYYSGDTLGVSMEPYETVQIQSFGHDLTGANIRSTMPVAVFSGSEKTPIRGFTRDHLVEQLPPVNCWGKQFLTVPVALRNVGDIVRVVGSEANTTVEVYTNETEKQTFIIQQGEFAQVELGSETYATIDTSAPVMVVQFGKSQSSDLWNTDPFMVLLPPSSQYENIYRFTTVKPGSGASFDNFINLVVKSGDEGGIIYDGEKVVADWSPIAGSDYVGLQMRVAEGTHLIHHESPIVGFGAILYGHALMESYGYPAGMRLASLGLFCNVTETEAGDGLDNDCDDRIDEEILNMKDDDQDGLVDEDLAEVIDILGYYSSLTMTAIPTTVLPTTVEPTTVHATTVAPTTPTVQLTTDISTSSPNSASTFTITEHSTSSVAHSHTPSTDTSVSATSTGTVTASMAASLSTSLSTEETARTSPPLETQTASSLIGTSAEPTSSLEMTSSSLSLTPWSTLSTSFAPTEATSSSLTSTIASTDMLITSSPSPVETSSPLPSTSTSTVKSSETLTTLTLSTLLTHTPTSSLVLTSSTTTVTSPSTSWWTTFSNSGTETIRRTERDISNSTNTEITLGMTSTATISATGSTDSATTQQNETAPTGQETENATAPTDVFSGDSVSMSSDYYDYNDSLSDYEDSFSSGILQPSETDTSERTVIPVTVAPRPPVVTKPTPAKGKLPQAVIVVLAVVGGVPVAICLCCCLKAVVCGKREKKAPMMVPFNNQPPTRPLARNIIEPVNYEMTKSDLFWERGSAVVPFYKTQNDLSKADPVLTKTNPRKSNITAERISDTDSQASNQTRSSNTTDPLVKSPHKPQESKLTNGTTRKSSPNSLRKTPDIVLAVNEEPPKRKTQDIVLAVSEEPVKQITKMFKFSAKSTRNMSTDSTTDLIPESRSGSSDNEYINAAHERRTSVYAPHERRDSIYEQRNQVDDHRNPMNERKKSVNQSKNSVYEFQNPVFGYDESENEQESFEPPMELHRKEMNTIDVKPAKKLARLSKFVKPKPLKSKSKLRSTLASTIPDSDLSEMLTGISMKQSKKKQKNNADVWSKFKVKVPGSIDKYPQKLNAGDWADVTYQRCETASPSPRRDCTRQNIDHRGSNGSTNSYLAPQYHVEFQSETQMTPRAIHTMDHEGGGNETREHKYEAPQYDRQSVGHSDRQHRDPRTHTHFSPPSSNVYDPYRDEQAGHHPHQFEHRLQHPQIQYLQRVTHGLERDDPRPHRDVRQGSKHHSRSVAEDGSGWRPESRRTSDGSSGTMESSSSSNYQQSHRPLNKYSGRSEPEIRQPEPVVHSSQYQAAHRRDSYVQTRDERLHPRPPLHKQEPTTLDNHHSPHHWSDSTCPQSDYTNTTRGSESSVPTDTSDVQLQGSAVRQRYVSESGIHGSGGCRFSAHGDRRVASDAGRPEYHDSETDSSGNLYRHHHAGPSYHVREFLQPDDSRSEYSVPRSSAVSSHPASAVNTSSLTSFQVPHPTSYSGSQPFAYSNPYTQQTDFTALTMGVSVPQRKSKKLKPAQKPRQSEHKHVFRINLRDASSEGDSYG